MNATRRSPIPRAIVALSVVLGLAASLAGQDLTLPNKKDSVRFAVIGDSGSGATAQYEVGQRMTAMRAKFPFDFVLMMGDNLYGGSAARDYQTEFELPYKDLLAAGVKFYASLGNHDDPNERMYKPFNMGGERYYTFKPGNASVRFFALDSNLMDPPQLAWLEKQLASSQSDWKIMYFHHPLYSSGATHGSTLPLREKLEPLFLKYGVDVVLSGHDHFYERIKPQKGIYYFVSGGAGKLRKGDITRTALTDKGFDTGFHFMLFEITADTLYLQTISDKGVTVDSGALPRRPNPNPVHSSR